MMRRRYSCPAAFIAIIITCFALYGCNDIVGKEDIRASFLKVFFTSNYENRYSTWLEQVDTSPLDLERPTREYYSCIQKYVNEELYNRMIANRDILSYDESAIDNEANIYPTGIRFTEYAKEGDKTTYTFIADLRIESANESSNGTINGQITVQQNGDTSAISNIYISK